MDQPIPETVRQSDLTSTTTPQQYRTKIGKKKTNLVEDKILTSLENYEKRAKKAEVVDDNHHFALSLVPTLASLPKHLNMKCRLEIMQTLAKYVTEPHQPIYQPLNPTSSFHQQQQYGIQPQQQYAVQHISGQQGTSTQPPAPSPAASYLSNFSDDDSQFSIF